MTVRVLVVDDSNFFCQRVVEILNADTGIRVVGVANNGQDAISKAMSLKPDVITMDVEMPIMDGITATRTITKQQNVAILMLSSLTYEGARMTLDALSAGAVDFLLKSYEDVQNSRSTTASMLREKVLAIGKQHQRRIELGATTSTPSTPVVTNAPTPATKTPTPANTASANTSNLKASAPPAVKKAPTETQKPEAAKQTLRKGHAKLVAIGSSTGGPVALQQVLQALPGNFPTPIIIAQHMPGTFTPAFAARLDSICQIRVSEAKDGDVLQRGHAYLAPGGKQMTLEKNGETARIRIRDTDKRLQYAPCVDVTFGSAAQIAGGQVLAIVLTGMGADGREGARMLRNLGATIWTQDEASCVVYGMPQAVNAAGLSHQVLTLNEIGPRLASEI